MAKRRTKPRPSHRPRSQAGEAVHLPSNPQLLRQQIVAAREDGSHEQVRSLTERLHQLRPHDVDVELALGEAYLKTARLALARRTFRDVLSRHPAPPLAAELRELVAFTEAQLTEILPGLGAAADEDGLAMAESHERLQSLLYDRRFAEGRKLGEQLVGRWPRIIPPYNNLSTLLFMDGDLDGAIAMTQRALAVAPQNLHAQANLIRFLTVAGRSDEAARWGQRLRENQEPAWERWSKTAEALSYLGDDAAVVALLKPARAEGRADALLLHLAACAARRLGNARQARALWRSALKEQPGLRIAQQNLADLDAPPGEQNGPWPFELTDYLPWRWLQAAQPAARGAGGDEAFVRRMLQEHPGLLRLVPHLLERGDASARTLATLLARHARTPEALAALRAFASGPWGKDAARREAAIALQELGELPRGPVSMWFGGQLREVQVQGLEIHSEASEVLLPAVQPIAQEAYERLQRGEDAAAEGLLRKALALQGDEPSLLNNLAKALAGQGRIDEAMALSDQILARFPDYFFGRITAARRHLQAGRLAEVRAALVPLMQRSRLHVSEALALFSLQADLAIVTNEPQAAAAIIESMQGFAPEHPVTQQYAQRLPLLRMVGPRYRR